MLLFERSRQRPLTPPCAPPTATSSSKDKASFLKSFLHRLTRMHGILFSMAAGSKDGGDRAGPLTSTYSLEMERILCKDLQSLLAAGVLGAAL